MAFGLKSTNLFTSKNIEWPMALLTNLWTSKNIEWPMALLTNLLTSQH